MPNWCENIVTISHVEPAKIAALAEAYKQGNFCNHVIPVPQDLIDAVAGTSSDPAEQLAIEAKAQANLEKYGYTSWYDFCVDQWGTKWDVNVDCDFDPWFDNSNTMEIKFDSAWSPPLGIYERLYKQGYTVTAYYYEPSMGFVGKWEEGQDNYYDYGGSTSATVRDIIGDELDDCFGISQSMLEWEEENEEELTQWIRAGAEEKGIEPHKLADTN